MKAKEITIADASVYLHLIWNLRCVSGREFASMIRKVYDFKSDTEGGVKNRIISDWVEENILFIGYDSKRRLKVLFSSNEV